MGNYNWSFTMKLLRSIFFLLSLVFLTIRCDFLYKNNGKFGSSLTKEEALNNGSEVLLYLPNKNTIELIDGTSVKIDTVWTEVSFIWKNNRRVYDSKWGYVFNVPYEKEINNGFVFKLSLLDTTNQEFSHGTGEKSSRLRPKKLKERIDVIVVQKSPLKGIGWKSPSVTDTIVFRRIH